jgi:hypothetical protein
MTAEPANDGPVIVYSRNQHSGASVMICVATGKRCYVTHGDAERFMAHLILHGRSGRVPCRAYPCDRCGGWHLTSRPQRYR